MTDLAATLAAAGSGEVELSSQLIDLAEVEIARRATVWHGMVHSTFPGLTVTMSTPVPQLGTINRFKMGAGELFAIESAPVDVRYRPPATGGVSPHLSLMVQSRGSACVTQSGRECRLAEGDLCLLDETSGFRMICEQDSGIVFLRLPRAAALSRYPHLERLFPSSLPASEPGTGLLAGTLLRLMAEAAEISELQRAAMMDAVIQMLGVAEPFSALPETADWRVRRALDFIELNLSVAGLTAENVAQDQRISRRRLDQLMREAFGHSVASHLWSRRLERAAADLRDPRRAGLPVAQIAFANGFEDAAHFTRAFKRRYSVTPGQWRLN